MAEKAWRIRRLYVAEEATFNTDPSADGSTGYSFLRAAEMTLKPTVEVIPRPLMTDDLTRTAHVMGAEGGTLSFKLEAKGSGTAAGASTAAIAPESDLLLKHALGSVTRQTGSTVVSATNNTVTVTGGHGTQFQKYGMIEVASQRRFITSISTDQLTVHANWATNPSASDIVYASSLYKPANTGHKSLAFVADIDGVLYTLLGCVVEGLSVEGLTANGVAMLNASFKVASWETGGKGSLPATTAATAWPKPPVAKGSPAWVDSTAKLVHEFGFNFGVEMQFKTTTEGTDGKSDFLLTNRAATGSLKPYYASADWDDFRQGTERAIGTIVGTRSEGFGIYCPKAQYTDWALEDRNGLVGENVPFAVNDNGADADFVVCTF